MIIKHWIGIGAVVALVGLMAAPPQTPPVRYYVQLVWGTNEEKPKNAHFRPVGPKLKTELGRVFQWQRYWEVARQETTVRPGKATRLRLSPDCEIQLDFISPTVRETCIYGKGVLVTRSRRRIDCHRPAIHGGSTATGGSWFVVVREDRPTTE